MYVNCIIFIKKTLAMFIRKTPIFNDNYHRFYFDKKNIIMWKMTADWYRLTFSHSLVSCFYSIISLFYKMITKKGVIQFKINFNDILNFNGLKMKK